MNWKKERLFENLGKKVYSSKYGFCIITVETVTINDKPIDQVFLYSSEVKAYVRFDIDWDNFPKCIKDIFNGDIATRKPPKKHFNYYLGDSFSSAEANILEIKSMKIGLRVDYWTSFINEKTQTLYEEVVLEKESDAKKYSCWVPVNQFIESIIGANISKIKVGDKLYLMGVGEVTVTRVNSFPNSNNSLFVAVDSKGNNYEAIFGSSEIYYLPCHHAEDLFDEIDDTKNEQLLLPYVSYSKEMPGVYNVYWNSIEEASRYIVSIFVIINAIKGLYYHLADYDIDRNTHYFAIDKLIGGDFVFKVIAEDRNGKIIAKSSGIVNGCPKTFRK